MKIRVIAIATFLFTIIGTQTYAHELYEVTYKIVEQKVLLKTDSEQLSNIETKCIIEQLNCELIQEVLEEKEIQATHKIMADSELDAKKAGKNKYLETHKEIEKVEDEEAVYMVRRMVFISAIEQDNH